MGWTMARCVDCDREGCQKVEVWTSFVACNCAISMANPCEHQKAAHTANADCAAHAVNWRERALAAEAQMKSREGLLTVSEGRRMLAGGDWVPVGERLPGDLLDKIVVDRQGYVFASRKVLPYDSNRWKDIDGETVTTDITHWMDLPATPVVSETERSDTNG